jgi:putative FmdB family regulatory protein
MPVYEYRCENGHHFEVVQRMADAPLTECQVCGAPVQRVMFAPAVHFKGSGFYNTDYGTAKRKRELETSASEGADKHDAKMADKKKDKADAAKTSSTDGAKSSGGDGAKSNSGSGSGSDAKPASKPANSTSK